MSGDQNQTTKDAFDQIVREWALIPAMPTRVLHDQAVSRMLARATEAFGADAAEAAWARLGRNKGWHS